MNKVFEQSANFKKNTEKKKKNSVSLQTGVSAKIMFNWKSFMLNRNVFATWWKVLIFKKKVVFSQWKCELCFKFLA